MKLPLGSALLIASHNPGKVAEIAELLIPYGIAVRGAAELNLPEPVEDGDSFAANAAIKARAAAKISGLWSLSDDSGLCVTALGGAPGIYSARWAGHKDFPAAMARIERELMAGGAADMSAKFVCVLALAAPGGEKVQTFTGEVHGRLSFPPRGANGFGYDPIFVADGMDKTFGEIAPEEKHAISHRTRAFANFCESVLPS